MHQRECDKCCAMASMMVFNALRVYFSGNTCIRRLHILRVAGVFPIEGSRYVCQRENDAPYRFPAKKNRFYFWQTLIFGIVGMVFFGLVCAGTVRALFFGIGRY